MTTNQPVETFTTYSNGEQLPPGWIVRSHPDQGSWTASKDGFTRLFGREREAIEKQVTWEHRRETAPGPVAAPPAPPAVRPRRRRAMWPLLTAGALALFLLGGATGAALVPTPEPVTHTSIKEVEVEVPVTPAACAEAIDQIMEFRLLAMEMMTAAIDSDVDEMTAVSDDMGVLNLLMATKQEQCLNPAIS